MGYGERINQMVFSETYSGYMSTITLDNQSPYSLYIDVIKCSAVGACQDMQIKTIGATINDMQFILDLLCQFVFLYLFFYFFYPVCCGLICSFFFCPSFNILCELIFNFNILNTRT